MLLKDVILAKARIRRKWLFKTDPRFRKDDNYFIPYLTKTQFAFTLNLMLNILGKIFLQRHIFIFIVIPVIVVSTLFSYIYLKGYETSLNQLLSFTDQQNELRIQLDDVKKQYEVLKKQYEDLKNTDQIKINTDLKKEIDNIQSNYKKAATIYEQLSDLKFTGGKVDEVNKLFASALSQLSERKYEDAGKSLDSLTKKIEEEKQRVSATVTTAKAVVDAPVNNTAPTSGYSRQKVSTDNGEYVVDIIAADLASTRVIVDIASEADCPKDCPVLSLGDFVSRNSAFAGINGSYFCPADYPSCADKKNSFDTLVMNKNKKYFNSDNNVHSQVPLAVFSGDSARFLTRSADWGRDTGVDGVIANYPLMILGGNIIVSGGDEKQTSTGNRSFIAHANGKVFIGVVRSASVGQAAKVLKAMGMNEALNLDSGGSTALWSGGYKAGPGRAIPNAILFVRK